MALVTALNLVLVQLIKLFGQLSVNLVQPVFINRCNTETSWPQILIVTGWLSKVVNIFNIYLGLLPWSLQRHLSHKRRWERLLQFRWNPFSINILVRSATPWVFFHWLQIILRRYVLFFEFPLLLDWLNRMPIDGQLFIELRDLILIYSWIWIYTLTV
jgi:hypothetical protein